MALGSDGEPIQIVTDANSYCCIGGVVNKLPLETSAGGDPEIITVDSKSE